MSDIAKSIMVEVDERVQNALKLTAEALVGEIVEADVIPRMTGRMEDHTALADVSEAKYGKVSITSPGPYGARLYQHPEYNFHRSPWEREVHHRDGSVEIIKGDGNPNAQAEWFEPWLTGDKKNRIPELLAHYMGE